MYRRGTSNKPQAYIFLGVNKKNIYLDTPFIWNNDWEHGNVMNSVLASDSRGPRSSAGRGDVPVQVKGPTHASFLLTLNMDSWAPICYS